MKGDVVFRVYDIHAGRERDNYFGAFRTRPEADAEIARLLTKEMDGANWAARYHDQGFVVREQVVDPAAIHRRRARYHMFDVVSFHT